METLLHYVWKNKLYTPGNFISTEGISLEIIDPGIYNTDAGPDFFNAKIKMGQRIWAGNVEIHNLSSDWYKHKHHNDPAYNSVILHVIETMDQLNIKDSQGRAIPQWILSVPQQIKDNYQFLIHSDYSIPCQGSLWQTPSIYLSGWKDSLLIERLERKVNQISFLGNKYYNDWNETFYIILARSFGFGINNDSFERLAESLPLKQILKHQNSVCQTEALFLGQAGLLNDMIEDEYYKCLQNEYHFLSKKYHLKSLDGYTFKSLRIRPESFPPVKIVQLAGLIRRQPSLFSCILERNSLREFQELFTTSINPYWNTHYQFGKLSSYNPKNMGLNSINCLIINTVIPILLAYGKKKNIEKYIDLAFNLLEIMKPENNFIVNTFKRQGVIVENAGDSQALIQLKREYCEKKKCFLCRIGHQILTNKHS